jgi:hypothetical protein
LDEVLGLSSGAMMSRAVTYLETHYNEIVRTRPELGRSIIDLAVKPFLFLHLETNLNVVGGLWSSLGFSRHWQ